MNLKKYVCVVLFGLSFILLASSVHSMSRPVASTGDEEEKSSTILQDILMPDDLNEEEKANWKNGEPPGWSRGRKTGWGGGDMPPGLARKHGRQQEEGIFPADWDKREKKEQEIWKEKLEKIRERIHKYTGKEDEETMLFSTEEAAKKGVPLQELENVANKVLQRKLTSEEYDKTTRAMAYGVDKKIDSTQLGSFVNSQIEKGVRGNELAINIYKEIAARSQK
jgi:hypothetical protein